MISGNYLSKRKREWNLLLNVSDGYIGIHHTIYSHVKFYNKKF